MPPPAIVLPLLPLLLLLAVTPSPPARSGAETFALLKDGTRLPLFTERYDPTPVARVGTSVVTLRELTDALAAAHQERTGAAGGKDFGPVLDRLVDVRLVTLEARSMGVPELPEFRSALAAAEERLLRESLRQKVLAGVKADPRDLERASRDALREWTLRPVLFEKEADARAFRAALRRGARFDDALEKSLAEKKAKARPEPQALRETRLPLELRGALRGLARGEVTPPVKAEGGFLVAQMLGKRQVDDPQERAKVRASVEAATRVEVLRDFQRKLVKKYARVDEKLVRGLDLEAAKPGLEALAGDGRILARIRGENPIAVSDLVRELRTRFFHGVENQQRKGRLNAQKQTVFDDMLEKRLFAKEARARGLQDEPELRYQVEQFANQLALSATIERVVAPTVSVTDDDLRRYYREHPGEFTTPPMFKLDGIAFSSAADAEAAFRKLRGGTDLKWLRANAEGQLDPQRAELRLDGATVSASEMPRGLADALAGAQSGDYRLYADPGGAHYVVRVVEHFPPQAQPFEAARSAISGTVSAEKLNEAFRQWVGTLRRHYPVEILIAGFGS